MALILYPNGLTEEYYPSNDTFTEDEILNLFNEYDYLKSHRFVKILNGWVLWGEYSDLKKEEELDFYNKIISRYLKEDIYSHVLFIHDTELSKDWKVTDDIIQFGYDDFKKDIGQLLDDIAEEIINETNKNLENGSQQTMYLKQIGVSNDKRIIFEMDPDEQPTIFYNPDIFQEFANKIIKFFKNDYSVSNNFSLYADKNIIISVHKDNVKNIITHLLTYFNNNEEYEKSKIVTEIYNGWLNYNLIDKNKPKRKRGRPKKNTNTSSNKDKNKE